MSSLEPGPEIFDWMALRRVHDGGVVALSDGYVDHERPITGDVASALDRLIQAGALALGIPDPVGHRMVCVTVAGQSRYTQLRQAFHG